MCLIETSASVRRVENRVLAMARLANVQANTESMQGAGIEEQVQRLHAIY
jgi:hypothetical protein